MRTISVRDFRSNMASSFDKTDAGEQIVIRRKNRLYAIVPIDDDELTISQGLQAKIDNARKEYEAGETVTCKTKDELHDFLESL